LEAPVVVHVFIGPTLGARQVLDIVPGARLYPPVKHGDLTKLDCHAGDVVVIVDGYFHQVGAVRHKEILDLLARGVRVVGSSSMGALRAAELHPFGMVGCGTVFEMYRDGLIDSDGEVVVVHGEEPDYRNFSLALVNVRHGAAMAVRDHAIDQATADAAVDCAREVHYVGRSWRALHASAAGDAATARAVAALDAYMADHPEHANVKATDAVRTLRDLADLRGGPLPAGWLAAPEWRTRYLYDWHAGFRGRTVDGAHVPDAAVLRYRQIHDPDFPALWRRHVLAQICGLPPGADCHALEAEALAAAHARRLTLATLSVEQMGAWLTDDELKALPEKDALLAILVRSYRRPGVGVLLELSAALSGGGSSAADAAARAIAATAGAGPLGGAEDADAAARRHLVQVWHVDDDETLRAAALDRGFTSAAEAAWVTQPFCTASEQSIDQPSFARSGQE
jgi:hypothetical protein